MNRLFFVRVTIGFVLVISVLLGGCSYRFGDYYIVFNEREYSRLYNGKLADTCWHVPYSSAMHNVKVYYGYKTKAKAKRHQAKVFNDPKMEMFLLNNYDELYYDTSFDWPTCSNGEVDSIILDASDIYYDKAKPSKGNVVVIDDKKTIEILQRALAEATKVEAWQDNNGKTSYSLTREDLVISVTLSFKSFPVTFNYGLLSKQSNGDYYVIGDYLSDIDKPELIKGEAFLLNKEAQSVLSKLV